MTIKGQEIWELTIPGRVSFDVTNSAGRRQPMSWAGKGTRIRVKSLDRELAEEAVRNEANNPFRNGMLIQVNKPKEAKASKDELSDEDLSTIFEVTGTEFEEIVGGLSEVNIRRLKDLSKPVDASRSQCEFLEELIAQRFTVGGSTPTYDEMQQVTSR